ncbi:DUF4238 domain-containing protein [Maridesulfovibrio frigidus]|uniref:DUF4238 domain-containing protein n=1 Tax=Maridesulfovibrio frigidus TaxID=340956 RepID=UPI0004E26E72|nr:DUF4238 domain-containing protein [Maridesulfovibrio frigidus]
MCAKDKHHYVQQAYLKGFCSKSNPSELWEYDKKEKVLSNRIKSVRLICCSHHYYAVPVSEDEIDHELLENAFNLIEDPFIRVLRTLGPKKDGEKIKVSHSELMSLAEYISFQLVRVPMFRDNVHGMARDSVVRAISILLDSGEIPHPSPEVAEKINGSGGLNVKIEDFFSLPSMGEIAPMIIESLLCKRWFLYVPHADFNYVVSDNPARFISATPEISVVGPADPFASIYMPLRKDLALAISPQSLSVNNVENQRITEHLNVCYLNKNQTKYFNRETAKYAQRFVYNSSQNEKLSRMIFKLPYVESCAKAEKLFV